MSIMRDSVGGRTAVRTAKGGFQRQQVAGITRACYRLCSSDSVCCGDKRLMKDRWMWVVERRKEEEAREPCKSADGQVSYLPRAAGEVNCTYPTIFPFPCDLYKDLRLISHNEGFVVGWTIKMMNRTWARRLSHPYTIYPPLVPHCRSYKVPSHIDRRPSLRSKKPTSETIVLPCPHLPKPSLRSRELAWPRKVLQSREVPVGPLGTPILRHSSFPAVACVLPIDLASDATACRRLVATRRT